MTDSALDSTRPRLTLLWRARRELGAWVTVVGVTPQGDPVVQAGTDRLVLRSTDGKFWPVGRCRRCGAELASLDLEAHEHDCPLTPTQTSGPEAPAVQAVRPQRSVALRLPAVAPQPDVPATTKDRGAQPSVEPAPKRQENPPEAPVEAALPPLEPSGSHAAPTPLTMRGPLQRTKAVLALLALAACLVAVSVFLRWLTSESGPTNRRPLSAPTVPEFTTISPQPSAGVTDSVVTTLNTTLAAPPTTPGLAGTNASALTFAEQLAVLEQSVAEARPGVIENLPKEVGTHLIRSVDRLEFDRPRPAIRLEVTSPAASAAQLREAAWTVTRWMLLFWDTPVVKRVPNAVPAFRLILNKTEVECSPGLMLQLRYGGASQEQWAAECGRFR